MVEVPSSPGVHALVRRLALHARDTVGRCDSAGMSVVRNRLVVAFGATDHAALDLDVTQHAAGDGPCLDPLRDVQLFNLACIADVDRWPDFGAAARANAIRSSLSVPMTWRRHPVGVMNLYSRLVNGFDDCEHLATLVAARAAGLLWRALRPAVRA